MTIKNPTKIPNTMFSFMPCTPAVSPLFSQHTWCRQHLQYHTRQTPPVYGGRLLSAAVGPVTAPEYYKLDYAGIKKGSAILANSLISFGAGARNRTDTRSLSAAFIPELGEVWILCIVGHLIEFLHNPILFFVLNENPCWIADRSHWG